MFYLGWGRETTFGLSYREVRNIEGSRARDSTLFHRGGFNDTSKPYLYVLRSKESQRRDGLMVGIVVDSEGSYAGTNVHRTRSTMLSRFFGESLYSHRASLHG